MIKSEIRIPLLNANEPEARLVSIHIKNGQAVKKGERLFTIETTKAASDIEAPEDGYIHIMALEGETLVVGDWLAIITEKADDPVDMSKYNFHRRPGTEASFASTGALRITKPARALAAMLGVELATLPTDHLVTEEVVRRFSAANLEVVLPASDKPMLLIYGAGGHAKSVMEIVLQNNLHTIVGIVDDDPTLKGKQVLGIPVLGTGALVPILEAQGVKLAANGVGGILDINVRVKVFEILERAGFSFPTILHPRATIEPSAMVEEGVQVFATLMLARRRS